MNIKQSKQVLSATLSLHEKYVDTDIYKTIYIKDFLKKWLKHIDQDLLRRFIGMGDIGMLVWDKDGVDIEPVSFLNVQLMDYHRTYTDLDILEDDDPADNHYIMSDGKWYELLNGVLVPFDESVTEDFV